MTRNNPFIYVYKSEMTTTVHVCNHSNHVLASCLPWVPEKGTVGASGDLAPLAHLALGMMGEGKMWSPECGWGEARYVSRLCLHRLFTDYNFIIYEFTVESLGV